MFTRLVLALLFICLARGASDLKEIPHGEHGGGGGEKEAHEKAKNGVKMGVIGTCSAARSCSACSRFNKASLNEYRARHGLHNLKWNERLAGFAVGHSQHMYLTRQFVRSRKPYTENIAFSLDEISWSGVSQLFHNIWVSRGANNRALLSSYRCVGIGIYGDGANFYGTQMFSNHCE